MARVSGHLQAALSLTGWTHVQQVSTHARLLLSVVGVRGGWGSALTTVSDFSCLRRPVRCLWGLAFHHTNRVPPVGSARAVISLMSE